MAKDEARKLSSTELLKLAFDKMQKANLLDKKQRLQVQEMIENGDAQAIMDLVSEDDNRFVDLPGRYETEFNKLVIDSLRSKEL